MKRILHLTMVCLMVFMAACSNDEPTPPAENAIENAAKKLNGYFSYRYMVTGNIVTEAFEFSPYSEPKTVGAMKVYGSLRHTTSANMYGAQDRLYTFSYSYGKLYLNLLYTDGSEYKSYILSDVKDNSFHLRHIDMDEDSYMVFIRS